MGRPARFIPENADSVLVEITCRTIGARALLVPSPRAAFTYHAIREGKAHEPDFGRLEPRIFPLCRPLSVVAQVNSSRGLEN